MPLSLVGNFDINVIIQILFRVGITEKVVPFCFCRASFAESDSSWCSFAIDFIYHWFLHQSDCDIDSNIQYTNVHVNKAMNNAKGLLLFPCKCSSFKEHNSVNYYLISSMLLTSPGSSSSSSGSAYWINYILYLTWHRDHHKYLPCIGDKFS